MSTYQDFFIRGHLGADNTIPATGTLSSSPDIIPVETHPIKSFQEVLASDESYSSDPGTTVSIGYDNYIYVRGKNGGISPVKKKIYLYYVPASIINWPSKWKDNGIPTAAIDPTTGKEVMYVTVDGSPNQVLVGNNAFIWRNVQPPPAGSDHYCLIAQVTDDKNSNPIPHQDDFSYEDMASLMHNNLGFGWRNVTTISKDIPTWNSNTTLDVPLSVKTAKYVHVYVDIKGHKGAEISFQCSTQDKSSTPIEISKTLVTSNEAMIYGITTKLDPGFSGSITLNYFQNGITPSSDNHIRIEASYEHEDELNIDQEHLNRLKGAVGIEPTTPVYLGDFKWLVK
ncbi:hypothetical protein ACFSCX_21320 [Bacillus salitolerans]|uniref:Uncharacterized protein n=1 Tax=Bacillus salitolerans TaxID=1437434 RepID=A0ABW4LVF0_9BACI